MSLDYDGCLCCDSVDEHDREHKKSEFQLIITKNKGISYEWAKFTILHRDSCIDSDNCSFCQTWIDWSKKRGERLAGTIVVTDRELRLELITYSIRCVNCHMHKQLYKHPEDNKSYCKRCLITVIPHNNENPVEWIEEFTNEQIKNFHNYLHLKSRNGECTGPNGECTGPNGECLFPDPHQILCGNCNTFTFEAKSVTDEHDTYIWMQCATCNYQHGVSH